ncbi:hypothetical protein CYY_008678 [Polysphondylium violaceum]|uniref:Kinase n=1 Tax=Polysphondylium violaceum TaxID=133409 RepID=A0A8J4PMP6_9MYCE|nr:hypothetical protein CYY_008678 [Polysphondylium violaceum]
MGNDSNSTNSNSSSSKFNVVAGSTTFMKYDEGGKVLKTSTPTERDFYISLNKTLDNPLLQLIPKFYGVETRDNKEFLILQDLTYGYSKPCIADIKLGLTHHDVNLDTIYPSQSSTTDNNDNDNDNNQSYEQLIKNAKSLQKKANSDSWLVSKYITTPKLGFCICGSQKYNLKKQEFEKFQKEQGRTLTECTVIDKIKQFFSNEQSNQIRDDIVHLIVKRLELFKDYFENNPDFRFRSTSILLIYEGDIGSEIKCDIRLIDFAHAKPFPNHLKQFSSRLSNYNNSYSNSNNSSNEESKTIQKEDDPLFPIDGGFLFGISNLLKIISSFLE